MYWKRWFNICDSKNIGRHYELILDFLDLPEKIYNNWKSNIKDFSLSEIKKFKEIKSFLKVNSNKNDEGKASLILKKGCEKLGYNSKRTERWIKSFKQKGKWKHLRYGMINTYLKMFKKYGGIIKTNHNAVKIVDKDIDTRLYKIQYYNNGKKNTLSVNTFLSVVAQ